MGGIYAKRVIASVQYLQAFGNRPVVDDPGRAVGKCRLILDAEKSIALRGLHRTSGPNPASTVGFRLIFRRKSFKNALFRAHLMKICTKSAFLAAIFSGYLAIPPFIELDLSRLLVEPVAGALLAERAVVRVVEVDQAPAIVALYTAVVRAEGIFPVVSVFEDHGFLSLGGVRIFS